MPRVTHLTERERDHRNAALQALILGPLALAAFLAMALWYLLPLFCLFSAYLKGN